MYYTRSGGIAIYEIEHIGMGWFIAEATYPIDPQGKPWGLLAYSSSSCLCLRPY